MGPLLPQMEILDVTTSSSLMLSEAVLQPRAKVAETSVRMYLLTKSKAI
jgi:hypothetical protein